MKRNLTGCRKPTNSDAVWVIAGCGTVIFLIISQTQMMKAVHEIASTGFNVISERERKARKKESNEKCGFMRLCKLATAVSMKSQPDKRELAKGNGRRGSFIITENY
jgi:S-ribosylhomocysteine lyase LuxS involved in autoinducer biosynthesis